MPKVIFSVISVVCPQERSTFNRFGKRWVPHPPRCIQTPYCWQVGSWHSTEMPSFSFLPLQFLHKCPWRINDKILRNIQKCNWSESRFVSTSNFSWISTWTDLLPPANRVAKVKFSVVSVCVSTGGSCTMRSKFNGFGQRSPPPPAPHARCCQTPYGPQVDGLHSTEMPSCFFLQFLPKQN